MSKQYQDAATAYQDAYVSNMSGFEIVVELYKGISKNILLAKKSYESEKLDEMCKYIEKTNKILIALQSHLNHDKGGEAAVYLNNFYNGIFVSLSKVLSQPKPAEAFDHILNTVQPVYEIWCRHADTRKESDKKSAENTT